MAKYPKRPPIEQPEEKLPFKKRLSLWWDIDGGGEIVMQSLILLAFSSLFWLPAIVLFFAI